MEKINDSQFVSILRDWQTGLDQDPSEAERSTVSRPTFQLEFDSLLIEESLQLKL